MLNPTSEMSLECHVWKAYGVTIGVASCTCRGYRSALSLFAHFEFAIGNHTIITGLISLLKLCLLGDVSRLDNSVNAEIFAPNFACNCMTRSYEQ